ncbi:hypothetical protein [Azospirillum sp. sgz302134]
MEILYPVLYLAGLALFVLGLHELPKAETERRGNSCLLASVVSFAVLIAAGLTGNVADHAVLELMAGLAIAMAAVVTLNQRVLKGRHPDLPKATLK